MDDPAPRSDHPSRGRRSSIHVFRVFLLLGLTSFGGPIAHLGYFREAFVVRRRWLDDAAYADIVALCQILPGPASSQVGFAIGLREAGLVGALAAFLGFTLPSALVMFAAAAGLGILPEAIRAPLLHGLILVAVPVVAHAVFGMAQKLCNRVASAAIALGATAILLARDGPWLQPAVILAGGVAGLALLSARAVPRATPDAERPVGSALACLAAFGVLLAALPLVAATSHAPAAQLADGFYRTGALVFGGGHVILPLLEAETVGRGWLETEPFLAGYGVAQALPGPLTTFAAFLGATSETGLPAIVAGLIALVAIFLPGFLLVAGVLPFWSALAGRPWIAGLAAGAGAAVVGVLAAALWRPVITSAIYGPADILIASAGFVALVLRAPVWLVVLIVATAGAYSAA